MSSRLVRSMVTLREATEADAAFLAVVWVDYLRRADVTDQLTDIDAVINLVEKSPDQRIVIAEYDGQVAGAVYLKIDTVSPLNLTPALMVLAPFVLSAYRRKGVGSALMETAATWAEENGISHVTGAAIQSSRDANRYLARLGLGAVAVLRVGSTQALRDRVAEQTRAVRRVPGYRSQRVVAARRARRAHSVI